MKPIYAALLLLFTAPALASGSIDRSFAEDGVRIMRFDTELSAEPPLKLDFADTAEDGLIDAQGRYVSVGLFRDPGDNQGEFFGQITRHLPSGERDLSLAEKGFLRFRYDDTGPTYFYAVAEQSGRLIVGGSAVAGEANDSTVTPTVCRFLDSGQRDETFGANGCRVFDVGLAQTSSSVVDLVVLPDARIVVLVGFEMSSDVSYALMRLTPDGQPDPTFGDPECQCGYVYSHSVLGKEMRPVALAVDEDSGDLAVAGDSTLYGAMLLTRHESNGEIDTDFSTVGARFVDFDNTFQTLVLDGVNTKDVAVDLAFVDDGAVVIGGTALPVSADPQIVGEYSRIAIAKVLADGSYDLSFANAGNGRFLGSFGMGSYRNMVAGMAVMSGAIYVSAHCENCAENTGAEQVVTARLTEDGARDLRWGGKFAATVDVVANDPVDSQYNESFGEDRIAVRVGATHVVLFGSYVAKDPDYTGQVGQVENPFIVRLERDKLFSDGLED